MASPTPSAGGSEAEARVKELMQKSLEFSRHQRFPTTANLTANIRQREGVTDELIVDCYDSVRINIHPKLATAMTEFMAWKAKYGKETEKELFGNLSFKDFALRLVNNRPLVFYTGSDIWQDINGRKGAGWEQQGWDLVRYLSYDEIKLAAMLTVSSRSVFINDGSRSNSGRPAPPSSIEGEGGIIAAVGARFEVPGVMEWEDCIVDRLTTKELGFGSSATGPMREWRDIWAKLYGVEYMPGPGDQVADGFPVGGGSTFNNEVYQARIRLTAETILVDTNRRAGELGKKAHLHVVGLGMGVWQFDNRQTKRYAAAWRQAIEALPLREIARIDFAWIPNIEKYVDNWPWPSPAASKGDPGSGKSCLGRLRAAFRSDSEGDMAEDQEEWKEDRVTLPNSHILISTSKRSPHAKLTGEEEGLWSVESFAWDGNSFPGNEYWCGGLTASGDPAAACASMIPETHNHYVNHRLRSGDCVDVLDIGAPGQAGAGGSAPEGPSPAGVSDQQ